MMPFLFFCGFPISLFIWVVISDIIDYLKHKKYIKDQELIKKINLNKYKNGIKFYEV